MSEQTSAVEMALDLAIEVIEQYQLDLRNSMERVGIDLVAKGFCQGDYYRTALQRIYQIRNTVSPTAPKETLMKLVAMADHVIVRRDDAEQVTKGGIVIPDNAKGKSVKGTVVGVGPGGRYQDGKVYPVSLAVGDKVVFGQWTGVEVTVDEVEYLVLTEKEILAVTKE